MDGTEPVPACLICTQGGGEKITCNFSGKCYEWGDEDIIGNACEFGGRDGCIEGDAFQVVQGVYKLFAHRICSLAKAFLESILELVLDIRANILNSTW